MPSELSEIVCSESGRRIRWTYRNRPIECVFGSPVKVIPLQNGRGFLVVEPAGEPPDNAIILNPDGSQRTRVKNPEAANGAICFGDAYYVGNELTLIICFASWQMACVINETGKVIRTYETR